MVNSFVGQQEPENSLYHDMMISRLDSTWQDRIKHMARSSTTEDMFKEIDRHMLSLHPLHNCRIIFLNLKPKKDKLHSRFLARIMDEASVAEIG